VKEKNIHNGRNIMVFVSNICIGIVKRLKAQCLVFLSSLYKVTKGQDSALTNKFSVFLIRETAIIFLPI
jgi:hypothetical protein